MSDDGKNARAAEHDEPQDEVEAHHKTKFQGNEEPAQEGDDEVEAHRHIRTGEPDNKFV